MPNIKEGDIVQDRARYPDMESKIVKVLRVFPHIALKSNPNPVSRHIDCIVVSRGCTNPRVLPIQDLTSLGSEVILYSPDFDGIPFSDATLAHIMVEHLYA